ncbi:MAG TPA: hypothetical protein VEL76_01480 [Gemmataceae bacterium]|nr:hypothetical protein [Gemmataceae bacterium]
MTATATYNTGVNSVTRQGSTTVDVWAVGVDRLQFQLPGGSFQDMPVEGLYVKAGTNVTFQALPTPSDAPSFPSGKTVWGGSCGATGTGPTTSCVLTPASVDMSDTQTITAESGNTVTGSIVRYGADTSSLTMDWYDSNYDLVVYIVSYQLWVPDDDGDGRPDAAGGSVVLQSIDFNSIADYVTLPGDPPLSDLITWSFLNGEKQDGLTTPAFATTVYEAWGQNDPLIEGPRPRADDRHFAGVRPRPQRSAYDFLLRERGEAVDVLGQGKDDPEPQIIATVLEKLFPGANAIAKELQTIKALLRQTPVPISPNDGTATNGQGYASQNFTTSDGTELKPDLTVTAKAWQVPLFARFTTGVMLKVEPKAKTALDKIRTGGQDYYCMPFLAIADRFPDIRGTFGPYPPFGIDGGGASRTAETPPILKGPTGGIALERVRNAIQLTRTGYVVGALNYVTVPDMNNTRIIFGPFGITTKIDYYNAEPIAFATTDPAAKSIPVSVAKLTAEANELRDRGYTIGPAIYASGTGNLVGYFVSPAEVLSKDYTADYISVKLTIEWR